MRAQARVEASKPYAQEITRVLSALASLGRRWTTRCSPSGENPKRAAVLVITSDRGLAGAYNVNVLRRTEELLGLLREEGKEPVLYVVGRKGVTYYRFRDRDDRGDVDRVLRAARPTRTPRRSASALIDAFTAGEDDDEGGAAGRRPRRRRAAHRLHRVPLAARRRCPVAKRMAPLEVEEVEEFDYEREDREAGQTSNDSGVPTSYEFEPSAEALLDALLPNYITTRIYAALLESAASESASRRRAMKSATDNAEELIKNLTRQANQARQAEITQEISEIVGGADALVSAGAGD